VNPSLSPDREWVAPAGYVSRTGPNSLPQLQRKLRVVSVATDEGLTRRSWLVPARFIYRHYGDEPSCQQSYSLHEAAQSGSSSP
jgi:hypothetical protein